jgi:hypothetical protein
MSSRLRLTHWQRPEEISPGTELDALKAIYSLCLQKYRAKQKEGGWRTAPDDAKKEFRHVGAKNIVPE